MPSSLSQEPRRLFRELDILTIIGRQETCPEEGRFLLNTQLMFLKREKRPNLKADR